MRGLRLTACRVLVMCGPVYVIHILDTKIGKKNPAPAGYSRLHASPHARLSK